MVISVACAASTQLVQVPTGNGKPTPVSKSWYVDDSAFMQAGKRALEALNRMVNETGLMYYFLGLERRAKKCFWVRLCWVNGALQRKAVRPDEQLLCKEWVAVWSGVSVAIVERKPKVVQEYDYDEEFRRLGYSASITGSRGNSTKIPSPRMGPAERPTDPGRRGKEGSKGGIKKRTKRAGAMPKKNDFFQTTGRHPPGARRETTEVKTRKC